MKTAKSKLLSKVEAEVKDPYVDGIGAESALIVDAMAILQMMKDIPSTFGELANELLSRVVNMAVMSKSGRVDFVADRYPKHSIKNLERSKRSENGVIKIYSDQQRVPHQWKKFLSSGQNKEDLMKFFAAAWRKASPQMLKGVEVLIAHEEKCHKLKASGDYMLYALLCALFVTDR